IQSGISSVASEASIRLMVLARERHGPGVDPDEPVSGEGANGLAVELLQRPLHVRDEPQRHRPALPERAFERPLLALRLEAATPARAELGESAVVPARNPREADRRAEVHQ